MAAKLIRDIRPTKTRPRRAEARRQRPGPLALNADKWDMCKADVKDFILPTSYDIRHSPR